jgi:hypothetical protein
MAIALRVRGDSTSHFWLRPLCLVLIAAAAASCAGSTEPSPQPAQVATAEAPPDPWEELRADACRCADGECHGDIHQRATELARTTEAAKVEAYAAKIGACLDSHDDGIVVLTKIRGQACACTDMACLEQVQRDLAAAANVRTRNMDRATAIAGEIAECMMKVMAASGRGGAATTEP